MNRSKRFLNNSLEKAMKKEVRKGQRAAPTVLEEPLRSDQLSTRQMLKKYPKKIAKEDAALVLSTLKGMQAKKAKKATKTSKRTTPGMVPANSTPHIIHVEGGRWMKTVQKQTTDQTKKLTRRLAKGKTKTRSGF
jgi:hypothetical protein